MGLEMPGVSLRGQGMGNTEEAEGKLDQLPMSNMKV